MLNKIVSLFFVLALIGSNDTRACDGLSVSVVSNSYIGNGQYLLVVDICEQVSNSQTLNGVVTDWATIYGLIITVNGANIVGVNTPTIIGVTQGTTVGYTQTTPNQIMYGDWGNPAAPIILDYGDPIECWTIELIVDAPASSVDVWSSSSTSATQPGAGMTINNGIWGCGNGFSVPPVICNSDWTPPTLCSGSTTPIDLNLTTLVAGGTFSGAGVNSATGMFDPTGITTNTPITFTVTFNGVTCSTTQDIAFIDLLPPGLIDQNICPGDTVNLDGSIGNVSGNCSYTVVLDDSYGDGWNGAVMDIYINGVLYSANVTVPNCGGVLPCQATINIPVSDGDVILFNYTAGSWNNENTIFLYDSQGALVSSVNDPPNGNLGSGVTVSCPTPTIAYSWSPTLGLSDPNIPNPDAFPGSTTLYTVTISSPDLPCTTTASVTVTVDNCGCIPPVLITDNQTVCDPTTVDLNASINGASGAGIATFYTSSTDATAGTNAIGAIVSLSGTYFIRLEDPTDPTCFTIAPVDIIINPIYNSVEDITTCENTTVNYPDGTSELITASTSHTSYLLTLNGCDSIIVTNVTMNPITVSIENITLCTGSDHLYPDGTLSTNITANETHVSTFVSAGGCDSTLTTNITIDAVITATESATICPGDDYTYPDGTISANITINESHISSFISAGGCDSLLTTNIVVSSLPNIDAGIDITVCEGENVILTGSGGTSYSWDNNITNGAPFTPALGTITYTVTGTNALGCINTDQVDVTATNGPDPIFVGDILQGCSPHTVTFTNLTVGSVDCFWEFGNGTSSTDCGPISVTYEYPGFYDVMLTVTDQNGCSNSVTYTDYIHVENSPLAGFTASDMTLDFNNSEVHFNNTSVNAESYIWDFGDESPNSVANNPSHLFPGSVAGNYVVTLYAYNAAGCTDSFSLVIAVEDILIFYVPNTFTPDGDEYNDIFKPIFTSGYDPFDFELLIFNRWGEIIWESHDVNVGWRGTYAGNEVQDGTYTWKMEFKETMTDERHFYTGHITKMR